MDDALGRGEDPGAEAAGRERELMNASVDPPRGPGHPVDLAYGGVAPVVVLEVDEHGVELRGARRRGRHDAHGGQVALRHEQARDRGREARVRVRDRRAPRKLPVADPREQVADRVAQQHALAAHRGGGRGGGRGRAGAARDEARGRGELRGAAAAWRWCECCAVDRDGQVEICGGLAGIFGKFGSKFWGISRRARAHWRRAPANVSPANGVCTPGNSGGAPVWPCLTIVTGRTARAVVRHVTRIAGPAKPHTRGAVLPFTCS